MDLRQLPNGLPICSTFVGVCLHLENKDREHYQRGDLCQLFVTGGEVRCLDLWQAWEDPRTKFPGPEIGDQVGFMLRRYPWFGELERAVPTDADAYKAASAENKKVAEKNYWVLVPYVNKVGAQPCYTDHMQADGSSIGCSFAVGKVKQIYNAQEKPRAQMTEARKIIWEPRLDGSLIASYLKLRHLHIDVGLI